MKIMKIMMILSLLIVQPLYALALEGVVATEDGVQMLKEDLLSGRVQIGKTRLKDIRKNYGDAPDMDTSEKRIKYNYGDLRLTFEKKRIWTSWEYDGFKDPVYSDDVDDLRYDLESGELVGENITLQKIIRKYDVPTEMDESENDGELSVYYYGNIKLVFENQFLLQNWRGQQLGKKMKEQVLEGK